LAGLVNHAHQTLDVYKAGLFGLNIRFPFSADRKRGYKPLHMESVSDGLKTFRQLFDSDDDEVVLMRDA